MNAATLKFALRKHGVKIITNRKAGYDILVNLNNKKVSQLPAHLGREELGSMLVQKILDDLGIAILFRRP